MVAFSSYTDVSTIKCPGSTQPALRPSITNQIMRQVNWLLNNYYNQQQNLPKTCTVPAGVTIPAGMYQNTDPTGPGTYPISKYDMQAAVWTLTGVYAGVLLPVWHFFIIRWYAWHAGNGTTASKYPVATLLEAACMQLHCSDRVFNDGAMHRQ